MIVLMEPEIYRLPTNSVGFDWTFESAATIRDVKDAYTIEQGTIPDTVDELDEKIQEMKLTSDDTHASAERRLKPSPLKCSFLLTGNDYGFVFNVTPTPGTGEEHVHLLPVLTSFMIYLFEYYMNVIELLFEFRCH